jgi:hypothetical protein
MIQLIASIVLMALVVGSLSAVMLRKQRRLRAGRTAGLEN